MSTIIVPNRAEQYKRLVRRFHPNAWPDVKAELARGLFSGRDWRPANCILIKDKFRPEVMEAIRRAFDEIKDFSWRQGGMRRDVSVEIRAYHDDPVYGDYVQAWYSSKYKGCGNGSYYLLINPTTASLREDD